MIIIKFNANYTSPKEVNKRIFLVSPSAAIAMKGLFMIELVLITSETNNSQRFFKKCEVKVRLMATTFHLSDKGYGEYRLYFV